MRARLTIQELEAFVDLAQTLSFRASAARCFVSQPAFSRTIASAETKLGTRLFDRNTRRVALTGSGAELLPVARRIVFELHGSLSDLSEFVAGHRGQFTVASVPGVMASVLPTPMQGFLKIHPEVSIALESGVTSEVIDLVDGGAAHIGFCAVDTEAVRRGFAITPLLQDDLVLACAASDPLAARKSVTWKVLTERPYIASGPASAVRMMVEKALADAGIDATPRYVSANVSVTGAMVAAGLGVAVIPTLAKRLMHTEGLAFVRLCRPSLMRPIGIIMRRGRSLPPAAMLFVRDCVAYCRAMTADDRLRLDGARAEAARR